MTRSEKLKEYDYTKVPTKAVISEKEEYPFKYGFGVRHIQVIIIFLCFTVNVMGRAHFAVTIVAMTTSPKDNTIISNTLQEIRNNNSIVFGNTSNNTVGELVNGSYVSDLNSTKGKGFETFVWPKWIQEMLLNAFYLGYTLMMFPMGMVCQRYGGKLPLQISLFINAITCVITPASWGGWKAVCGCRLLQGLAQTGTYPCTQSLLSKWVPANERASLSSYVYAGMALGTIIAYQLAGFLGASSWGWPLTFYTVGAIFFVCFILLTVFGAASPVEHKSITEEEKGYIISSENDGDSKKMKTPWREIFTSKIIWALMITHTGSVIGYVFFFIQVPSYIHYILGVNVSNSGILSSLPYVASMFTTLAFGWLSDYCTNKKIVTLTNARKIFNSAAHFGIAIPLILTSYTTNTTLAVTLLVVAMAIYMGVNCGWMVNYIDISPNFSGTLTATGNTLGNAFVVMTPIVVSYVVTDTSDVMQWRIMFFIIAAVMLITNTVYVVMGTAEIQEWNFGEQEDIFSIENSKEDDKKQTEKQ